MTAISAGLVKELREKTGAGMLDCRNALAESEGDMNKAVEYLRKKGVASADKKAGRLASEGLIHICFEKNRAALVEVNCETDFVGKNEDFQKFIKDIAEHVNRHVPKNMEELLTQNLNGYGKSINETTKDMVAKIGENISVRRFKVVEAAPGEVIGTYTHMGNKIGAIVRVKGDAGKVDEEILKGLAMHVAAASPRFLNKSAVPEDVKQKEREIYLSQLKDSGKPENILDKIVEGKINKFVSEVCFTNQIYIRDPEGKNSVDKFLKQKDPSADIIEFVRFQVGEGMEKKQEDFAAEVAKQVSK